MEALPFGMKALGQIGLALAGDGLCDWLPQMRHIEVPAVFVAPLSTQTSYLHLQTAKWRLRRCYNLSGPRIVRHWMQEHLLCLYETLRYMRRALQRLDCFLKVVVLRQLQHDNCQRQM